MYLQFRSLHIRYFSFILTRSYDLGVTLEEDGEALFLSGLWECTLSPQQWEICRLLSKGLSRTEAAAELGISVNSIKKQISRIRQKHRRAGGDKNDTKLLLQYPSVLLEELPVDAAVMTPAGEICDLIEELETTKGLRLTTVQKEIVMMKSMNQGAGSIAARLGISPGEVQASIEQAVAEIERVRYGGDDDTDAGDRSLAGHRSMKEAQVLSCLNSGMSVKATAKRLGKTWGSVRSVLSRSGVSAKKLKEQRKRNPGFKNNHYSPPSDAALSLLWKYYSGTLSLQEKVEAELILRSEGLIRSVPTIVKNNGRLLNMFGAQKRRKVFHVTREDERILRRNLPGMNGSILDYTGASLLLVNRYARDEEERGGTAFTHTYAVDRRFWPAIQMLAGGINATGTEQGPCPPQIEGAIGRGSQVLLRDLGTNEKIRVNLTDAGVNPAGVRTTTTGECYPLSPGAPLARALLGHGEGDTVSLEVVKGVKVEYQVLKILNP